MKNIISLVLASVIAMLVGGCNTTPVKVTKNPPVAVAGDYTRANAPTPQTMPSPVLSAAPTQVATPAPAIPNAGMIGGVRVLFVNKATDIATIVATPNAFCKFRGTFTLELPRGTCTFLIPPSAPGEYEYTWAIGEGPVAGHDTLMVGNEPLHSYIKIKKDGVSGYFNAVVVIPEK